MPQRLESGLIRVLRAKQPAPTGFDMVNAVECTFAKPVARVRIDLLRAGATAFEDLVTFDPPVETLTFPLPKERLKLLPGDLMDGDYQRRVRALTAAEEFADVITGPVLVVDPHVNAENAVRRVLSQRLGVSPTSLLLITFELKDWPDAGLGCPEPGQRYAQVVTPGFRLVMETTTEDPRRRYEYHLNEDATVVRFCGTAERESGERQT